MKYGCLVVVRHVSVYDDFPAFKFGGGAWCEEDFSAFKFIFSDVVAVCTDGFALVDVVCADGFTFGVAVCTDGFAFGAVVCTDGFALEAAVFGDSPCHAEGLLLYSLIFRVVVADLDLSAGVEISF